MSGQIFRQTFRQVSGAGTGGRRVLVVLSAGALGVSLLAGPALAAVTAPSSSAAASTAAPAAKAKPSARPTTAKPVRPSAPTAVVAVAGSKSAAVSWTAPTTDGGAPITAYIVKETTSGKKRTVRAKKGLPLPTSTAFPGLKDGVAAVFVVTARNKVGLSEASEPSAPVVPGSSTTPPEAVLDAAGAFEGDRGRYLVRWITLAAPVGSPVTVRVRTTTTGTAVPKVDFVSVDTSVTIPAGSTSAGFTLRLVDDAVAESDETIALALSSDTAQVAPTATITVKDDDATPTLYLDGPERVVEGNSDDYDLGISLRLSRPSAEVTVLSVRSATVDAATGLPASAITEIAREYTQAMVPAGSTVVPVRLAVRGDTLAEPDVRLTATIASPPLAVARGSLGVLIADDDTGKPTGPDLSMTASPAGTAGTDGVPVVTFPRAGTWTLTARNATTRDVAAAKVRIVVTQAAGQPLARLQLPDGCVQDILDASEEPVPGDPRAWTCTVGAIKAGGSIDLPVGWQASVGKGARPVVEAAVVWTPFNDPDHQNNRVRALINLDGTTPTPTNTPTPTTTPTPTRS